MPRNESQLQQECVNIFSLKYPKLAPLLFAIPNGGFRNAREARNLKKQGVRAGIPDLMLAVPSRECHGLFLELKFGTNKPTAHQRDMMQRLGEQGYMCKVVRSTSEFLNVCCNYLKE